MSTADKNKTTRQQRWTRTGMVILICLPLVAILLLLKIQTTSPLSIQKQRHAADQSQSSATIATPDTSTSIEHQSIVAESQSDTTLQVLSDIEGKDQRTPQASGTEDGYWDGYYDGATHHTPKQGFNDNSQFSQEANRIIYKEHYAKGYNQGYTNASSER